MMHEMLQQQPGLLLPLIRSASPAICLHIAIYAP